MKAKYCTLFGIFMKIGAFTIGGGYAMIPLMRREIVEKQQWMSEQHFLDAISLAQAMPGIFAVNMATQIGYRLRGTPGSIAAIAGNILVPIALILLIALFFHRIRQLPAVEHIFMGLRPAVVALIAAPVLSMARSAGVSWRNCWIPILSTTLIWPLGLSPILVVAAALLASLSLKQQKPNK